MSLMPEPTRVKLIQLRNQYGHALGAGNGPGGLSFYLRENLLFVLIVVLPTLISALYFGLVAADRYVSEVRFVVRGVSDIRSGVGGMLAGALQAAGGITRAFDEAHPINAYIQSRDAMARLREAHQLDAIYASPASDAFSRFPPLFGSKSVEKRFEYFLSMTTVKFDKSTGISTLRVQAFTPEDSRRVANALLEQAESLANRLTVRMRESMVKDAQGNLEAAHERVRKAQMALAEWRNREAMVDPTAFSVAIIEVIARLSLEAAQLRTQYHELLKSSPQSPQVSSLALRIGSLEGQIREEKLSLAGSASSLAPKIMGYEALQLERLLAEKLLEAATIAMELARTDAQRQQLYIERIVAPQLADYPAYPYRLAAIFATFVLSYLVYLIVVKLLKNLLRHGMQVAMNAAQRLRGAGS